MKTPYRQSSSQAGEEPAGALVIDACVTPLAILDDRLRVEHANPAFCALFDFEPPEGSCVHIADHAPDFEDDDALLDGLERAVGRDEPMIDYRMRLGPGHPVCRDIRLYARRIDGHGNMRSWLLVEAKAVAARRPVDIAGPGPRRQPDRREPGSVPAAPAATVRAARESNADGAPFARAGERERNVLDVAMEEQRRLGRELEENMLQSLAGLQLLIDEIREEHGSGRLDDRLVAWLSHATAEAGRQTRNLSRDLVVAVSEGELIDSLVTMTRRLGDYHGMTVELDDRSDRRPRDAWIETNLLRVVRGATLMALRDGRPVSIAASNDGDFFRLEISDAAPRRSPRVTVDDVADIRIMACHAELCGATLSIERRRGKGTATVVSLPLRSRNAA